MEDLASASFKKPATLLHSATAVTDRQPSPHSLYTSRSILSLSGLSVSDPLPGSYESTALAERKRRSSSVTSLQGGEEDDDDSRIPTTTFHYDPKMVISPLFLHHLICTP